jgi:hypothetical protein
MSHGVGENGAGEIRQSQLHSKVVLTPAGVEALGVDMVEDEGDGEKRRKEKKRRKTKKDVSKCVALPVGRSVRIVGARKCL